MNIHFGTDAKTGKSVSVSFSSLLEKAGHCMGLPGTGKTRFLVNLIRQIIRTRRASVVVIDLKGQLADEITNFCARNYLSRRCVTIDIKDRERLPGLNLFDVVDEPSVVAKSVKWSMEALFSQKKDGFRSWIEDVQNHVFGLLASLDCDGDPMTIFEAAELLSLGASPFRDAVLSRLPEHNLYRRRFEQYLRYPEARRAEMFNPILTRLGELRTSTLMTALLGQSRISVNFEEIFSRRGILVVNLHNPGVSDQEASFCARILYCQLRRALLRRTQREAENKPVFLVVDEAQKLFSAADAEELADLTEFARSFGVNPWFSHQNLGQLLAADNPSDRRLIQAFVGLAKLRAYFATDVMDASERELWRYCFAPEFNRRMKRTKHELFQTKFEPVQEWLDITSSSESESESGEYSTGLAVGTNRSEGENRSQTRTRSAARAVTDAESEVDSYARARSSGDVSSQGYAIADGMTAQRGRSLTIGGDGHQLSVTHAAGSRSMYTRSGSHGRHSSETEIEGKAYGHSHAETCQQGESRGETQGRSGQQGTSHSVNVGRGHGRNATRGTTVTPQLVTFYELFRELTSVTFPTEGEVINELVMLLTHPEKWHFTFCFERHAVHQLKAPVVELTRVLPSQCRRFLRGQRARYASVSEVAKLVEHRIPKFLESVGAPQQRAGSLSARKQRCDPPPRRV